MPQQITNESRLIPALQAAEVVAWDWDPATNMVFHAGDVEGVLGLPQYSNLNDLFAIIHPEDYERVKAVYEDSGVSGAQFDVEYRIIKADSTIAWITDCGRGVATKTSPETRIAGVLRDSTELKNLVTALTNEKGFSDSVIDSIPGLFYMLRPPRKLVRWNRTLSTISGYSDYEIQQMDSFDFFSVEQRKLIAETAEQVLRDGKAQVEADLITKQGRAIPFLLTGNRIEMHGEVYLVGTGTDITALEQSNKALKAANADLQQFAFSASHDLQEPLRILSLSVQMVKKVCDGKVGQEALSYMNHSIESAGRMQQMIINLRNYVLEISSQHPEEASDANQALDAALANLEKQIEDAHANIQRENLPTVPMHAFHLQQVFQNLVGNAIKYRSSAPLTIGISCQRGEGEWRFAVEDNGIGIDPKYAERIFGLFKRLHGNEQYPGTGFGLTICKRIVERYHGHIWVESKEGQGAKFLFTIPRDLPVTGTP